MADRFTPRTRGFLRVPLIAAVVILAMAGIAVAQIPDTTGVIHGCRDKKTGEMRVIDYPAQQCRSGEAAVNWNQKGDPGRDGTNGTNGAPGVNGTNGVNGLSCWDTNGDHVNDANEDVNGDGQWNALDCRGADGTNGVNGTNGVDGTNGAGITDVAQLEGVACNSGAPAAGTVHVSYDANGGMTFVCNPSANKTLTVTTSGTGSVTSSPAGIDCGSTCTYNYVYNTVVTLTATSDYAFLGWTGACTGSAKTCTVTMTEAKNVAATWSPLMSLIVNVQGANAVSLPFGALLAAGGTVALPDGRSCHNDSSTWVSCEFLVTPQATLTLTATPDPHTNDWFRGWDSSSDCTPNGTQCVLTMTSNKTVSARFSNLAPPS